MRIRISLPAQTLELHDDDGTLLSRYLVSTARNGAGELNGSYCTPRGRHLIRAKIGADQPANTVFVRRRPTGECWTPELAEQFPNRDWMLTRILWLSGLEPGFNRLGNVDTMRRYIYLHGCPDTVDMGTPGSIGCVRMRNADIIALYEKVPVRTRVDIVEFSLESGGWTALADAARPVRAQVFIAEQGVPEALEWDDEDAKGLHVVARGPDGEAIGTGRLLPDGRVGRMAVLKSWRGKGVGRALLDCLIEAAAGRRCTSMHLHAQTHAADFYRRFGFVPAGEVFLEAGIPHIEMRRQPG